MTDQLPAVFGAVLVWGLRNVDLERLGLQTIDNNPRVRKSVPAVTEKDAEALAASNGVTAPTAPVAPETAV